MIGQRSLAALLLTVIIGAASADAQSVCAGPPLLGEAGPEICVHIEEVPTGASMDFRAPAAPGDPPLFIPLTTIGDYSVTMAVSYDFGPAGMSISMTGMVTRTGAGTGGIVINADGGWGTPLPEGAGQLTLFGGTSGSTPGRGTAQAATVAGQHRRGSPPARY